MEEALTIPVYFIITQIWKKKNNLRHYIFFKENLINLVCSIIGCVPPGSKLGPPILGTSIIIDHCSITYVKNCMFIFNYATLVTNKLW